MSRAHKHENLPRTAEKATGEHQSLLRADVWEDEGELSSIFRISASLSRLYHAHRARAHAHLSLHHPHITSFHMSSCFLGIAPPAMRRQTGARLAGLACDIELASARVTRQSARQRTLLSQSTRGASLNKRSDCVTLMREKNSTDFSSVWRLRIHPIPDTRWYLSQTIWRRQSSVSKKAGAKVLMSDLHKDIDRESL